MVIDTSAPLAILLGEPERKDFLEWITKADVRLLSAANVLETGLLLETRRGEAAGREFDLFVLQAALAVVVTDSEHVETAGASWRSYGKGRHKAGLNFGDCFAYALAKISGEALLFKGDDFSHTDLIPAAR